MICRIQKRHAELTLGLHLLVDIVVDVETRRVLLTEMNVVNDDLILLADTEHAPRSLVHQSGRPPRRREDHTAHMLQIQTGPTALHLYQHHGVLDTRKLVNVLQEHLWQKVLSHSLVQNCLNSTDTVRVHLVGLPLRLGDHVGPLTVREPSVIHQDLADTGELLEVRLEDIHLVLEVAEDDKALGLGLLTQDFGHLVDFGGPSGPVGAPIGDAREATLLGGDVDLGMHADLTETQENRQERETTGVVLLHQVHHVGSNTALNAPVEGRLVLGTELDAVGLDDGLLGEDVGHLLAHQTHGATEGVLLHPALKRPLGPADCRVDGVTQDVHQGREIRATVDDGRAREHPVAVSTELLHSLCLLGLPVPQGVGLITHDALEMGRKGVLGRYELIVVGQVDLLCIFKQILPSRLEAPGLLVEGVDAELTNRLDATDPLVHHSQRAQNQGVVHRVLVQESDRRDGLAEPHVVAQETTTHLFISLALGHPLDSGDLVRVKLVGADNGHFGQCVTKTQEPNRWGVCLSHKKQGIQFYLMGKSIPTSTF
jgi:hypothetical protein